MSALVTSELCLEKNGSPQMRQVPRSGWHSSTNSKEAPKPSESQKQSNSPFQKEASPVLCSKKIIYQRLSEWGYMTPPGSDSILIPRKQGNQKRSKINRMTIVRSSSPLSFIAPGYDFECSSFLCLSHHYETKHLCFIYRGITEAGGSSCYQGQHWETVCVCSYIYTI